MKNIKLTTLQKDALSFFGQHKFSKNFYWTGGTLLSYRYLHHRDSVDLDFFSTDLFMDNEYLIFISELKKELNAKKITMTLDKNRRIYTIEKGNKPLKLELVFFPFPQIKPNEKLKEFTLNIDSLIDIMINKTLSAYQRNEPKDVFDLYCYLQTKNPKKMPELIQYVEKKFGVSIEMTLLLAKINRLSDELDILQPLLLKEQHSLKSNVKSFFQNIFDNIGKRTLNN